nr:hypothetical protein L204_02295 [Cryptococcus depauperatus CBS 7855]
MSRRLVEWEAEERKLQSVFDDVSYHRISAAQQTLNKYLKKHAKSQPALILKMYILFKSDADEGDILDVFKQVQALAGPKKEMTGRGVWWCTLTLRNMGRCKYDIVDLAQQVYQDLYDIHPEATQLLEQVFLHAAAARDITTMAQSSRKLFNSTRALRWARAAAWSEWAQKAPQPTPCKPYPDPAPVNALKIAQILLSASGKTCDTSEMFWLQSQIMLSNSQYSDLAKLATREALEGSLARLWWRMEFMKAAKTRAGNDLLEYWEIERNWVGGLLELDEDARHNYAFYKYLLYTTQLSTDSEALGNTVKLLDSLIIEIGSKERAPQLARLELDLLLRKESLSSKADAKSHLLDDETWLKVMKHYWSQWSAKGSIVTEIEGIWGPEGPGRDRILKFLTERTLQQHTDEQSYRQQVNAEILILRNKDADWIHADEDVKRCWILYTEGLQYGKNLLKTDTQVSDQIGLITANLLLSIWHTYPNDNAPLYKAILALEKICTQSPVCMHAHYLLIRLYRLIGAPSLIPVHLEKLGLTEIQLDNLLHVILERGGGEAVIARNIDTWSSHVDQAIAMYQRVASDFPEYVKECLANETYSQIPSIQYLDNALRTSLTSHLLSVEQARFHILTKPSCVFSKRLLQRLKKTVCESVTDLRNWELIEEIGGKRLRTRDITEQSNKPIGTEWVKNMGVLWLCVGNFMQNSEIGDIKLQHSDALLPFEQALVKNGLTLLGEAMKVLKVAEETINENIIKNIFDESYEACTDVNQSRWYLNQSLISLSQLVKISDIVLARISEAAKPVKGKKKPIHLTVFIANLKSAQSGLNKRMDELNQKLDASEIQGQCEWSSFKTFFAEDVRLEEILASIQKARKEALHNAKSLVSGKNIDH